MSGCVVQRTKKYTTRPSPAFPANQCCGDVKRGQDGAMWRSVADKNGVCRWQRVSKATTKTTATKAKATRAKTTKPKATKAKKKAVKTVAVKKAPARKTAVVTMAALQQRARKLGVPLSAGGKRKLKPALQRDVRAAERKRGAGATVAKKKATVAKKTKPAAATKKTASATKRVYTLKPAKFSAYKAKDVANIKRAYKLKRVRPLNQSALDALVRSGKWHKALFGQHWWDHAENQTKGPLDAIKYVHNAKTGTHELFLRDHDEKATGWQYGFDIKELDQGAGVLCTGGGCDPIFLVE